MFKRVILAVVTILCVSSYADNPQDLELIEYMGKNASMTLKRDFLIQARSSFVGKADKPQGLVHSFKFTWVRGFCVLIAADKIESDRIYRTGGTIFIEDKVTYSKHTSANDGASLHCMPIQAPSAFKELRCAQGYIEDFTYYNNDDHYVDVIPCTESTPPRSKNLNLGNLRDAFKDYADFSFPNAPQPIILTPPPGTDSFPKENVSGINASAH